MQRPRSTTIGVAGAIATLVLLAFWIVGQEASGNYEIQPPRFLEMIYPGTWHPFWRGMLWLVAGAGAVLFDLFIVRPRALTSRGRAAAVGFAAVTGLCFAIFAAGSFAGAGWSVIH